MKQKLEWMKLTGETVPTRQGYGTDAMFAVTLPDGTTRKVRMQVVRDAYDFQSTYVASIWTLGIGWSEVGRILPEDPRVTALPGPGRWENPSRREECYRAVDQAIEYLMEIVEAVLL